MKLYILADRLNKSLDEVFKAIEIMIRDLCVLEYRQAYDRKASSWVEEESKANENSM